MVHACTAGATASTQAEDAARLLAMINGAWTTQVIRTACALGLPDRLSQRPADALALAAACGCHGDALLRLLRAMAALDLCESVPAGHWRLTGMGRLLCRDASQSLHHWAQHAGSGLWQRLAELPEAVRTMLEEAHYFVIVYVRWCTPEGRAIYRPVLSRYCAAVGIARPLHSLMIGMADTSGAYDAYIRVGNFADHNPQSALKKK